MNIAHCFKVVSIRFVKVLKSLSKANGLQGEGTTNTDEERASSDMFLQRLRGDGDDLLSDVRRFEQLHLAGELSLAEFQDCIRRTEHNLVQKFIGNQDWKKSIPHHEIDALARNYYEQIHEIKRAYQ